MREATALAEFSGCITAQPIVRTRPAGPNGLEVPVLCLDISTGGEFAAAIHIEQPFAQGAHIACESAAKRLKKGQHITVQAPLHTLRLFIGAAAHIHIEQDPGS